MTKPPPPTPELLSIQAPEELQGPPPPPYMREIGTMWQIGVLTGKPCTFWGPKWVIFGVLALQK